MNLGLGNYKIIKIWFVWVHDGFMKRPYIQIKIYPKYIKK